VAIKEIKELKEVKGVKDPPSNDEQEIVNKEWDAEAKALDEISGLDHTNIIKRIAAIKRGKKRYFMFQWADGGSLRDFWEDLPRPSLDAKFIKEIVQQLRGLADALHELHNYKGSYRHGDLKPENILRFRDSTRVGILKIADMGLAKHHVVATYLRQATSTRYGTVRYEPPEVQTHKLSEEGRSRLYDIWSMGCITLELIVWLLYGNDELLKFNDGLKELLEESSPYFEIDKANPRLAKVHRSVRVCMDHISKDPECTGSTALRDLLEIVRTKLLVVHLPQHRPSIINALDESSGSVAVTDADTLGISSRPSGPPRASAELFRNSLDDIIGKGEANERYWFTGTKRDGLRGPPIIPPIITQELLSPNSALRPNPMNLQSSPLADRRRDTPPAGRSMQLAPSQKQNVSTPRCLMFQIVRSILRSGLHNVSGFP
jgi:serine/threonine protein kinase